MRARRPGLTGLCTAVLTTAILVSAPPAAAVTWSKAAVIDTQLTNSGLRLTSASCPASNLCAAIDDRDTVVTSTNPAGGPATWHQQTLPVGGGFVTSVACPTTTLCVAVGFNGLMLTSRDPTAAKPSWASGHVADVNSFDAVSCASASLCVAVGDNQQGSLSNNTVATSTNPAAGASSWSASKPGSPNVGVVFTGVSCPTNSFCAASLELLGCSQSGFGGCSGQITTSTNPAGGPSTWKSVTVTNASTSGISCASASLCVALSGSQVITSNNPTGASSAWSTAQITPGTVGLRAVSCPSVTLCVLVTGGTQTNTVYTSVNPTGGKSAWAPVNGPGEDMSDISCPSIAFCLAVDSAGRGFTSTNPTGGAPAWSGGLIAGRPASLMAVSCPSRSFCLAGDNAGNLLSSRRPGSAQWDTVHVPGVRGAVKRVACASPAFCLAVDGAGKMFASRNPAGRASSWKVVRRGVGLIACVPGPLCATLAGKRLLVSSQPAKPGSWHTVSASGQQFGVYCPARGRCVSPLGSCPTRSFCAVAVQAQYIHGVAHICNCAKHPIAVSSNPAGSRAAWHRREVPFPGNHVLVQLACGSRRLCVALDDEPAMMDSTNPLGGQSTWHGAPPPAVAVSCASNTFCIAVHDNRANLGR